MSEFKNIEQKLHQFTRKYYTNELIKGTILFFSLGFLYFFFTLFLEYFLWLKPTARTILFWLFIAVEVFLLIKFIAIPIFKLIGFRKGISLEESSKIIGNHFPEVEDKLLNVLQLKENASQSDLILASINQKSAALQPIPFVKAIDFKQNKKYLKYAIVPILIYVISLFTVSNGSLTQSLERVVNHRTAYNPPAPFAFSLENTSLQVIQGKPITITLKTVGEVIPNEAKIIFDNQQYYLQNNGNASFSYTFSDVQKPINFYVEANGVQSQDYQIDVIGTPTINNISLELKYPRYLRRKNEKIQNSGNLTVPEGTNITWNVKTTQTDTVSFINTNKRENFTNIDTNTFEYKKRIRKALNYQISSSNENLQDYENLQFSVDVVKDEYPLISVSSNIDSISRGTAQFAGQISDDYGLRKLQLVYYDEDQPEQKQRFDIQISKQNIQTFFYQFPDGLNLKKGTNYEIYFQVFDNDGVNGNKSAKSKVFNYRQKTEDEVEEELLKEQRNTINDLENSIQKQKKQQEQLENIQQDLQNKKSINWNDKKKVESFIKRQEQYKKMMQRQTDKLQENLDEKEEKDKSLQEKKEDLKERIKELKKLEKQQKLLDEIQKMADKLNKEDLVKKAKELAQQNKQQQRSLEKTLEMVKRFYVEQKTMQIANKIDELSKKQADLEKSEENTLEAQKEIKKEFDDIKKELEELDKDNEQLKEPMELPDVEDEKEDIDKELNKSEESLENQNQKEAKNSQQKSSKKMKEMSAKMQKSMMDMQGESMEENMEDLRKILENLVIFSFQQEQLMNKFSETSTTHPDFGKDLKKQNQIKTYFEHIDDSLYVLAMRVPKISSKIQDDLSTAHYNLDQSLYNFSENRFNNGISNQRYVMTATNNLADYLSNILNNMKNSMSMSMGKGKKGKSQGFSLPDLIKKQEGLSKKMKDGMKKGQKPGQGKEGNKPDSQGKSGEKGEKGNSGKDGKGSKSGENGKNNGEGEGNSNDDLDGELYEIFKQQSQLRQQLQNAIKESENGKPGGNGNAKKALKTMEELENEILEKGFNGATFQKMQNLNYELLKLEKAALEQGKDKKRKSTSNQKEQQRNKAKAIQFKKQFYNQIEILNRQSLPLQQNYKKKVRAYFSDQKK
ncbi:DUF4175 family protein [Polaribacter porphyrae]|uniref:DUF4175 domain-containing protein n=1 Tax=Polaribacter porphyrae TaxID=1137780 RepID=A0A2S7WQU9_9FLAO|nr:DUF4175 family protein [Polaribacter porphyrae]PQJ79963.1 hypothetical protein BTO18_12620 [Polaribacter porphyrae]